ncbi:MAG: heme exporter protein CcmD [Alphaproteobacteria bacterium HGW-Alphaproteobacteria-12]|nr:MAG: heme exporter protein CcmD [Alphaproteobacteria bacterium HGW-Alphaproteobacteria-12]
MAAFFHMGGYAAFIWPAYGLAFAVIAGLVWQSIADYRAQARLVEKLESVAGGRVRRGARAAGKEDFR